MTIEIWKKKPFGNYRKAANGLYVYLREGHACASWVSNPIGRSKDIPVSDELAAEVLKARRVPCPHVGTQPVYSMLGKPGYTCRDKSSGEDCNTVEKCTVCGYWDSYSGNPSFRAFATGEYSDGGHPNRTYLKSEVPHGTVTEADWSGGHLTLPSGSGTLIIWAKGGHLREDGAEKAAEQAFPNAEFVAEFEAYFVLRDGVRMAANN